jgi:hypothetical protein
LIGSTARVGAAVRATTRWQDGFIKIGDKQYTIIIRNEQTHRISCARCATFLPIRTIPRGVEYLCILYSLIFVGPDLPIYL